MNKLVNENAHKNGKFDILIRIKFGGCSSMFHILTTLHLHKMLKNFEMKFNNKIPLISLSLTTEEHGHSLLNNSIIPFAMPQHCVSVVTRSYPRFRYKYSNIGHCNNNVVKCFAFKLRKC